jgi:hypothetical protein
MPSVRYGIRPYSQGWLTSGSRPVVKVNEESLSQHDEKDIVPTPLTVGKGRKKKKSLFNVNLTNEFIQPYEEQFAEIFVK